MKGFRTVQAALAVVLAGALAAPTWAAPITRDLSGSITASLGSGADVGAGAVSGSVTYDDAVPSIFSPGANGGTLFDASAWSLVFSNGPALTQADGALELEVNDVSGDLLSLFIDGGFLGPFSGFFNLNGDVFLNSDGFTTDIFFDDENFNVVVEGRIAFARDPGTDVPAPATLGLIALGGALLFRRRRAGDEATGQV